MNLINLASMDQDPKKLLIKVVKLLDRLEIQYVLTGGLAVTIWGIPRYTNDADLIIQLQQEDVSKLRLGLEQLSAFGYVDEEMIRDALRRNSEFNYIDTEGGFKADMWIAKDSPFNRSCFVRRVAVDIGGYKVWVISPEDLIISKLDWWQRGSGKSEDDVRAVMHGQWDRLDWSYIESWVTKMGLQRELKVAKAIVDPTSV
jgi:hypothetical protein